jgi:arginine deiminase
VSTSVLKNEPVSDTETGWSVYSETGLLQEVIVHTPGEEMELVSPDNRLRLLFDDILFVRHAREEHELMCDVFAKAMGRSGKVHQVATLVRETFEIEDARLEFVERLCAIDPYMHLRAFEQDLRKLEPDEMFDLALTGRSSLPLNLHPLPNILFTRDLAAAVGDRLILSQAATTARARESVINQVVMGNHPRFAPLRDKSIVLPGGVTFEGGDLLVVSDKLVLIGHSERTSFGGVMTIAQVLFASSSVEHVLMVDLPKRRSCMHLDTVFTFTSPNECVYFPPIIGSDDRGNVVHFTQGDEPGRFRSRVLPSLRTALHEVLEREVTYIPCGGHELLHQEREQWTDGANFFAIAPGVVIGYERNDRTFDMMQEHGYRVVSAAGFLSYFEASDFVAGEKIAIKLEGNELSRGRGGPRCMTLPLRRSPIISDA